MNATALSGPIFTLPEPVRNGSHQPLHRNPLDLSLLSTFQRVLLTTDGTVTSTLEAYLYEQIKLIKLSEELKEIDHDIQPMQLEKGSKVIKRKILLRGKDSCENFIFAESIIALDRLEENFRNELLNTKTPIGKIWFENKVETFKEFVELGKHPAKELAGYFKIEPEENIISRTYCVSSRQRKTMMISEKFPESYFV